jgi:hypothetical protein
MTAINPPLCRRCQQPMGLVQELGELPANPNYSYFRCTRHPEGDTAFQPKEELVLLMHAEDGSLLPEKPYPFRAASYEEAQEFAEPIFHSRHASKGSVHRVGRASPLLVWDRESGWGRPGR